MLTPVFSGVLCLVGFMGAGKSTLGPVAARRLGAVFVDLDDLIQQQEGLSVSQIFSQKGESFFRRAESQALQTVLDQRGRLVLALGGGCFVQSRNRELLHQRCVTTVFLEVPVEELWARCQHQSGNRQRPLLKNETSFHQLYMQRLPLYRKAALTLQAGGKSPAELADELLAILGRD